MLKAVVVIPAYGQVSVTHDVVSDLAREADLAHVLVVDNGGDYLPVGDETVLSRSANLGWLRACNEGMHWSRRAYPGRAVVLLNNDTRLSHGFIAGLLTAARRRGVGAVGPCYDDHLRHLRCGYTGPASQYVPRARDRVVPYLDGTCMLLTPRALDVVPALDDDAFGTTGWGADIDVAVRLRSAGFRVVVTHRSYLTHATGTTAKVVHGGKDEYWARGDEDMRSGLEGKYGPHWQTLTGVTGGRHAALLLRLKRGRL